MKPIVIDVNCMTFQGIKDAIDEAYQAGLEDGYDEGYKDGKRSMQLTWHGEPIPTNIPATTPTPLWWDKHKVTCSQSKDTE